MSKTRPVFKMIIFLIIFSQPVLFPVLSSLLVFRPSNPVPLSAVWSQDSCSCSPASVKLYSGTLYTGTLVHCTVNSRPVYQCTLYSVHEAYKFHHWWNSRPMFGPSLDPLTHGVCAPRTHICLQCIYFKLPLRSAFNAHGSARRIYQFKIPAHSSSS